MDISENGNKKQEIGYITLYIYGKGGGVIVFSLFQIMINIYLYTMIDNGRQSQDWMEPLEMRDLAQKMAQQP